MARPRTYDTDDAPMESICVRLRTPWLLELDRRARATGQSRSDVVRALVAEAVGSGDRRAA